MVSPIAARRGQSARAAVSLTTTTGASAAASSAVNRRPETSGMRKTGKNSGETKSAPMPTACLLPEGVTTALLGAHHDHGESQEQRAERGLRDDQSAAEALRAEIIGEIAAVGLHQAGPRGLQRGNETEQQRGGGGRDQDEGEDSPVDGERSEEHTSELQ